MASLHVDIAVLLMNSWDTLPVFSKAFTFENFIFFILPNVCDGLALKELGYTVSPWTMPRDGHETDEVRHAQTQGISEI